MHANTQLIFLGTLRWHLKKPNASSLLFCEPLLSYSSRLLLPSLGA